MLGLDTVLIVDDSKVLLEFARTILSPHAERVVTADSLESARQLLEGSDDRLSLVLCDVVLPGGSGFELLEEIARTQPPRPAVIMITSRPIDEDAFRAARLGASGYLSKPLRAADIEKCLVMRDDRRDPRATMRAIGRAVVTDPVKGTAEIAWDIYDLSRSGAFLSTPVELSTGARLSLLLEFPVGSAQVEAEVVRVQQAGWGHPGGAGIAFRSFADGARETIEQVLERLEVPRA